MHSIFVEPSRWQADVVVPGDGDNKTALDLIRTWIEDVLAR